MVNREGDRIPVDTIVGKGGTFWKNVKILEGARLEGSRWARHGPEGKIFPSGHETQGPQAAEGGMPCLRALGERVTT
ncbi:MAG: hypothetical protein NVSMB9_32950 [Isosphaeraceae bacterium]